MNNEEKAKLGADSLHCFVNQFGEPDNYTATLLEVLFEEIYASSLSLFGQQEQTGNQASNNFNDETNTD